MADLTTLQTYLSEAEAALHTVMLGKNAQALGRDGKQVTYTPADAKTLRSYIGQLKADIASLGGTGTKRRGIGFVLS